MDTYEYSELLKALKNKVANVASIIKPQEIKARLDEIERTENAPRFVPKEQEPELFLQRFRRHHYCPLRQKALF